jgi:hypothetical protein
MAMIGRGAAVVQMLGGGTMIGRRAQAVWGTVHLALLPTNEDRAKAVIDWAGATFDPPARRPDHRQRRVAARPSRRPSSTWVRSPPARQRVRELLLNPRPTMPPRSSSVAR